MDDYTAWLTAPQAAQWLGISKVSIYQAIARGRIRVVETPLGKLVDPASVEEYARTRRPVRHKGERLTVNATIHDTQRTAAYDAMWHRLLAPRPEEAR